MAGSIPTMARPSFSWSSLLGFGTVWNEELRAPTSPLCHLKRNCAGVWNSHSQSRTQTLLVTQFSLTALLFLLSLMNVFSLKNPGLATNSLSFCIWRSSLLRNMICVLCRQILASDGILIRRGPCWIRITCCRESTEEGEKLKCLNTPCKHQREVRWRTAYSYLVILGYQ